MNCLVSKPVRIARSTPQLAPRHGCIGTRLHPDLMLLPFKCPVQTGNCSCLRNQLICTNMYVFCAGEGNWLCCNPYTENTDGGDDDDLHMFDYADADFTGNWSLWRTSSMIWYRIKPHDTMKGPKILVKQCIKSLVFFHENLMLWMHSVMWHSKSPTKCTHSTQ